MGNPFVKLDCNEEGFAPIGFSAGGCGAQSLPGGRFLGSVGGIYRENDNRNYIPIKLRKPFVKLDCNSAGFAPLGFCAGGLNPDRMVVFSVTRPIGGRFIA